MSNFASLTEGFFETVDDDLESQKISRVSPESLKSLINTGFGYVQWKFEFQ